MPEVPIQQDETTETSEQTTTMVLVVSPTEASRDEDIESTTSTIEEATTTYATETTAESTTPIILLAGINQEDAQETITEKPIEATTDGEGEILPTDPAIQESSGLERNIDESKTI